MFTNKDVAVRTIFVINCINQRSLRVSNGELLLEEATDQDKMRTLTKMPFQKMLALFVIGHITVTTPLLEKCKKFNVALVVMKPNLRPVFYWAEAAEGNFLLRQRQYWYEHDDITVAKCIVRNKVLNQQVNLKKTRRKDALITAALEQCEATLNTLDDAQDYKQLLGMEGNVSKLYFKAYFDELEWKGRRPRLKTDVLNVTLDIGYTILFNYMESFVRMFGFDIYIGVYHRLWFKRKSLICDLIEPFRCIIDHAVLLAFKRKQFNEKDFEKQKAEYHLKYEKCADYYQVFYEALIPYKSDFFMYVQNYYRYFMRRASVNEYQNFIYK